MKRIATLIINLLIICHLSNAQCYYEDNEDNENNKIDKKKRDCWEAIEIDLKTGYFKKNLPFDEPFFIKIKDSSKIDNLIVIISPIKVYAVNRENNKVIIRKKTSFSAKRMSNSDTFYIKIDKILEPSKKYQFSFNNVLIPASTSVGYESRAKSYLSADVGFLAMPNVVIGKEIKNYTASPYLGMNIYFSPVNKYSSLGVYRNTGIYAIKKRFCLTVGTTFSLVKTDDFKVGFLTGFGYRITSALKIGAGYVMYNSKEDAFPDINYKFRALPYLALSLDWDLKDLIPRKDKL